MFFYRGQDDVLRYINDNLCKHGFVIVIKLYNYFTFVTPLLISRRYRRSFLCLLVQTAAMSLYGTGTSWSLCHQRISLQGL